MRKAKETKENEFENTGVQLRPETRKRLKLAAIQRDLELREALDYAIVEWVRGTHKGHSSPSVVDAVTAWLRNPPTETDKVLGMCVVAAVFGGGVRTIHDVEEELRSEPKS